MPITRALDDGTEEVLYTAQEVAELEQAKQTAEERAEKLELVTREKTDNIKKLRDMSDQEKENFSAVELENRRVIEELQEKLEQTTNALSQKEKNEIERKREAIIKSFVGDDDQLKSKFLEEYNLINIDEVDDGAILSRAKRAAKALDIETGNTFNPINAYWEGEAPKFKPETEAKKKEEFLTSDKANAVFQALGDA